MNLDNFTFLTEEQIFGDNQLDIIKRYGTVCTMTDFSILLGGAVSYNHTIDGDIGKGRFGEWWTKTSYTYASADYTCFVTDSGDKLGGESWVRSYGARPALSYSSIKANSFNKQINIDGIKEIEYGEYPQTVVDEDYSCELEILYNNGSLRNTGKIYTTDSVGWRDGGKKFIARTYIEYEYNGRKYIRFVADSNCADLLLSDCRKIGEGEAYWVCVEPITWLVDEEADIALSKKIIFSGVQFKNKNDHNSDFDRTDIKQFMDNFFSKEIGPDKIYSQNTSLVENKSIEVKELVSNQNPYGFDFKQLSEEDIIKGAVESNVAVFLSGKSSESKSIRVKQLDPDCEIIYMRNATSDSLNGKSIYNTATEEVIDVPPTWYLKIKEKCEREPDKIHIIYFDELTKALPSIQGIVFNTVLDGEVNGKWKLPSNVRIVASGNYLDDSLDMNMMTSFAYVYVDITTDEWLKWVSTKKKNYEKLDYKESPEQLTIHPSIYAFVAYRASEGCNVLRQSSLTNISTADPKKWEMASKVLYKTRKPEMLRAFVGDKLTDDFISFAKEGVITVEDVLSGNYSDVNVEINTANKFSTAAVLSGVDEENMKEVRGFVKKLGPELVEIFDDLWSHGDKERLELIDEAEMSELLIKGKKRYLKRKNIL